MTRLTILATVLALTSGVALAQTAPLPTPPAPGDVDLDAEAPPVAPTSGPSAITPAPELRSAPPMYAPPSAPEAALPAAPRALRPEGTSVGLGAGWDLPVDLQTPNITSVRFRLASGLTLEPQVGLVRGDSTIDEGTLPDSTTSSTGLLLGVLVRKPLRERGKADLDLVGGVSMRQEAVDPEGEDNNQSWTNVGITYGVAVGYWLTPHFQLSVTGLNRVYTYTSNEREQGVGGDVITEKSSAIGLVFDPNVIVMVHLYL